MTLKNILQIGLISSLALACSREALDVKIDNITVKTKFINLDSAFINSTPTKLISNHHLFQSTVNDIYSYELGYCLKIGEISDTAFIRSIFQFTHDNGIIRLENRIQEKFKNLESKKKAIIDGLKHLKYHFPSGKIPENIVFMNSLFQSNAFCTEKEIGIGLERYLGKKVDIIKELPNEPFYDWIKEGMDVQYMERDAICSWIITHYIPETDGTLAENIIKWGKIIYLTEAAFPSFDKNIIIRYTKEDYDWAVDNEMAFWKYLVNEKMLFKNNDLDKANLLKEAPFTIGLPEKSPDRFGQFLGWQMVRHYMKKTKITLEELIKIPYNNILQEYEIED
jgi:hypothetical protein